MCSWTEAQQKLQDTLVRRYAIQMTRTLFKNRKAGEKPLSGTQIHNLAMEKMEKKLRLPGEGKKEEEILEDELRALRARCGYFIEKQIQEARRRGKTKGLASSGSTSSAIKKGIVVT